MNEKMPRLLSTLTWRIYAFRFVSGFKQPVEFLLSPLFPNCIVFFYFFFAPYTWISIKLGEHITIQMLLQRHESTFFFFFLLDLNSKRHLQETVQQVLRQCSSTPTFKTNEGRVRVERMAFVTAVKSPCKAAEFSQDSKKSQARENSCSRARRYSRIVRLPLPGVAIDTVDA